MSEKEAATDSRPKMPAVTAGAKVEAQRGGSRPTCQARSTVTTDPASIAAGANATVTVPITGAAVGDIVAGYSISRDSASTQFRDLDIHILVTTGAAQIVLTNNTAAALDPGNTIFTVWIRKAK
jgi:hypothetical protein